MGTYSYAVSRFVPDPVRNEAVNIGVIVVDPDTGRTAHRFLRDMRVLEPRCPGADLETLESMAGTIRVGDMPGGTDDLEDLARVYTNLLQFTPPRAVVAPTLEDSLRQAFERYVGEDARQARTVRPRRQRGLLLEEIDAALVASGITDGAVKKRPRFAGLHGHLAPDRGVFGDGWALALHALSFNAGPGASAASALKDAKVLAVDFEDARRKNGGLECTAVVDPPPGDTRGGTEPYAQASGHLKDRGCRIVERGEMAAYARQIGRRLGLFDRHGRPLLLK